MTLAAVGVGKILIHPSRWIMDLFVPSFLVKQQLSAGSINFVNARTSSGRLDIQRCGSSSGSVGRTSDIEGGFTREERIFFLDVYRKFLYALIQEKAINGKILESLSSIVIQGLAVKPKTRGERARGRSTRNRRSRVETGNFYSFYQKHAGNSNSERFHSTSPYRCWLKTFNRNIGGKNYW